MDGGDEWKRPPTEGIGGPGIEKSVARDSEMQLLDSGAKTTAEMLYLAMCTNWRATSVYICISLYFGSAL
jgi:hypothetical protein